MRSIITLLFITLSLNGALAQQHCDGIRYIEPVFTAIDSSTAISYGENLTANGSLRNLKMDLYYPAQEFFFKRPLIVLAHGGSFVSGDRHQLRLLCHTLAYHGFVAATIDYRLYDDFNQSVDSITIYDVVMKATGDMKAAVRWFINSASVGNTYGIDTNLIIVGGVSAGAITALHHAYLDSMNVRSGSTLDSVIHANGGFRGNSNDLYEHQEKVLGVLNFSGALKNAQWVDPLEPTLFSVHDEFDDVVPYGQDVTTELGTPVEVSGSFAVHQQALKNDLRSQLITIAGSQQHVSYFLNGPLTNDYALVMDSAMRFLEYTICDRISGSSTPPLPQVAIYPNPSANKVHIQSVEAIQSLLLRNSVGQLVLSSLDSELSLSGISNGIYTLEVIMKGGERSSHRILVQH